MARLVWLVLKNGRSVVAGCGKLNRQAFESLIAEPHRWMTLTAEESVDFIRGAEIRDFRLFEAEFHVPSGSAIYHFVAV